MTTSEKLDLSRLPPFQLVPIDYEAMLTAHLASLRRRLNDAGIDWDVDMLETDPLVISAEEITYRRMLDLQALNDTAKSLTLAFSYGGYLDHLAATLYPDLALMRLAGETDDRFRRRVALAAEARSEVTPGAYAFKALSSDVRIADARPLNYASGLVPVGHVLVVVLVDDAHIDVAEGIVAIAREAVMARKVRLSSEVITVQAAAPIEQAIAAVLHLRSGADSALVLAEAEKRLAAYLAERRRIGRVLSRSGIMAALHAGGVEWVELTAPSSDVEPGPAEWVHVTSVNVTTEVAP